MLYYVCVCVAVTVHSTMCQPELLLFFIQRSITSVMSSFLYEDVSQRTETGQSCDPVEAIVTSIVPLSSLPLTSLFVDVLAHTLGTG